MSETASVQRRSVCAVSILLLLPSVALAAGPYLVTDLNPGAADSFPRSLTAVGDRLFFAVDGEAGDALWSTDGTSEGTRVVSEVNGQLEEIASFQGRAFYVTREPAAVPLEGHKWDWKLWAVDSSTQDRTLLRTFWGCASGLTATEQGLFLAASDGSGYELWVSDGTPEGTLPLGAAPSGRLEPGRTMVYFFAGPRSLWASDGTVGGTREVAELPTTPSDLTAVGERLFFVSEEQLWVSDGTREGTEPRLSYGPDQQLAAIGDRLFFSVRNGEPDCRSYYLSDGTEEGTVELPRGCDEISDVQLWDHLWPRQAAAVGRPGRFFFAANAGALWISDGTEGGTALLKDTGGAGRFLYDGLRADLLIGGRLFFSTQILNESHGELWTSDGTPSGTVPFLGSGVTGAVLSRYVGDGDSRFPLAVAGETLYFQARDDAHGAELWALPLGEFLHPAFRRGDTNADGTTDLSDAIATLGFLFLGTAAPGCLDAADVNDSGGVDLSDAVFTLSFLFLGGPSPAAPFGECDTDPTADALDCVHVAPCR